MPFDPRKCSHAHAETCASFRSVLDCSCYMKHKKTTSTRVFRELTQSEKTQLEIARRESEANKDAILAEAKVRKRAWDAMRSDADQVIAALKAERERQGLSLADVERLCGLKCSALSRLENDSTANPTLLTLQRYAIALKLSLATSVKTSR